MSIYTGYRQITNSVRPITEAADPYVVCQEGQHIPFGSDFSTVWLNPGRLCLLW